MRSLGTNPTSHALALLLLMVALHPPGAAAASSECLEPNDTFERACPLSPGATLAGVVYAFLNLKEGVRVKLTGWEDWATHNNPFFAGDHSDLLGMIPFLVLTVLLYLVGRELFLKPKAYAQKNE